MKDETRVVVLECRNCRDAVIVVEELHFDDVPFSKWQSSSSKRGRLSWKGIYWWPVAGASAPPYVPSEIGSAFEEAARCLHARCYSASAVMSRKTLEAIVQENEVSSKNLKDGIEKLVDKKRLPEEVRELSHGVRLVGNSGAHFDSLEQVSKEDAQILLSFIGFLCKNLYGLKHDLQNLKAGKHVNL